MPSSRSSGWRATPRFESLSTKSPTRMMPSSIGSRPAILFNVVVLPHPDGPRSVVSVPLLTVNETLSTARTLPKFLTNPSMMRSLIEFYSQESSAHENDDERNRGLNRREGCHGTGIAVASERNQRRAD